MSEDKAARTFKRAPQPLQGLAEKIENIAAMTIDPPLDVIPHEIESSAGDGTGYLFVEVRSSVHAPHMVDGVYYGRGEQTRTRLSDAQVVHLHSQRQSLEAKVERLLDEEIARDLVPMSERKNGHLYLVAYPLSASRQAARPLVIGDGVQERFRQILIVGEKRLGQHDVIRYAPAATRATFAKSRSLGVAMVSPAAGGPGRTLDAQASNAEDRLVDIEFREDGSIAAILGRATAVHKQPFGDPISLIFDPLIVAYVVQLMSWTSSYSDQMSYRGQWAFGVHVSGLRGLMSNNFYDESLDSASFDAEFYREVTTATRADLDDRWQKVVEALLGRFTNALQTTQMYQAFFRAT